MFNLARAALTAAAFALAPGLAGAEPLNLLVMGEDADPDTIERHTPIFDRVVEAIAGEMRGAEVAVYDETAVTMEFYDLGRVRRPDAELISLARSVQVVPIDAVTAFEIHAAPVPSVYEGITDLRLRISGRVIAIATGQSLGGYEVSYQPGELPPLPLSCDRDCQVAFVGDQAVRVARDVGAALAKQLSGLSGTAEETALQGSDCGTVPNGFTMAFKGFSPEDLARIEAYLAAFQGYAHHRARASDDTVTEVWYETCANAERLEGNLRSMFAQTGAEVWLEADEQGFSAAKIAVPAAD